MTCMVTADALHPSQVAELVATALALTVRRPGRSTCTDRSLLVSPSNRELTKADLNGLESLRLQLQAQLAAQLMRAAPGRAQTFAKGAPPAAQQQAAHQQAAQQQALTSATTQIQALVTNALGGTSAQHNVQVQTGS